MNVERLNAVISKVISDATTLGYSAQLEALKNALQNQVNDPGNATYPPQVSASYDELVKTLKKFSNYYYPETFKDALYELKCNYFVPGDLLIEVERIFTTNQITPTKALTDLSDIQAEVSTDLKVFKELFDGHKRFGVEIEALSAGEAELTYIMPRSEVGGSLEKFARDNADLDRAIKFFEEVVTESRSEVPIKKISSSNFTVILAVTPPVLLVFSHVVRDLLKTYEKVLDVKIKTNELKALKVPEATIDTLRAHMTEIVNTSINSIIDERIAPFLKSRSSGRDQELNNEAKLVISRLADRIDRGYQIEVRAGALPKPKEDGEESESAPGEEKNQEIFAELLKLSKEIVFVKASGEPVLRLTDDGAPAMEA